MRRLFAKPSHAVRKTPVALRYRWLPYTLLALMGFVVLAWVCWRLQDSAMLPIERVDIQGHYTHVDRQNLRQAIMPFLHGGFFHIDLNALQDRLLQVPWVAKAHVSRIWPNRLAIVLQEPQPIASWNNGTLLDRDLGVFAAGHYLPTGLPHLAGPLGQQALVWQNYLSFSRILAPLGLKIAELTLTPRQAWYLRLDNGMALDLGHQQAEQRLSHFAGVYQQVFANNVGDVLYVDLRYSNGMAVAWKPQVGAKNQATAKVAN